MNKKPSFEYTKPLPWLLISLFSLIAIILALITGVISTVVAEKEHIGTEITELTDIVTWGIEEDIVERYDMVQMIASVAGSDGLLTGEDTRPLLDYSFENLDVTEILTVDFDLNTYDREGRLRGNLRKDKDPCYEDCKSILLGEKESSITFRNDSSDTDAGLCFLVPICRGDSIRGVLLVTMGSASIEKNLIREYDESPIGIFVIDSEGKILISNDQELEASALTHAEEWLSSYREPDYDALLTMTETAETDNCYQYRDSESRDMIMAYSYLAALNWRVLTTCETSVLKGNEVAHLENFRTLYLLIQIFALLLLADVVYQLYHRLRKRNREMILLSQNAELYREAILAHNILCTEISLTDGTVTNSCTSSPETDSYLQSIVRDSGDYDSMLDSYAESFLPDRTEASEWIAKNQLATLREVRSKGATLYDTTMNHRESRLKLTYLFYTDPLTAEDSAILIVHDITDQYLAEKTQEQRRILEQKLDDTNYKLMTHQIQPHFVYNTLASIREIILDDPDYGSDLILDFTTYLRSVIRSMSRDERIPFSQELKTIAAYANIEKMRFGDRLTVDFDIHADTFKVPPLSIQPLVENAIRHGILPRRSAGGTVTLRTFRENSFWVIRVEDTGVGFDADQVFREIRDGNRESFGLQNMIYRLESQLNARVTVDSEIGKGTCVTVRIPADSPLPVPEPH